MKKSEVKIKTPEGVVFTYALADPVMRCMAWVIDFFAVLAIYQASRIILISLSLFDSDLSNAFGVLLYFAGSIGYNILLEWYWNGKTVGKKLFGLQVIDETGLHLHFPQVLMRNLLRFVDMLPMFYFIGGLNLFFSPKWQRLGDYASGTIVIDSKRCYLPSKHHEFDNPHNSLKKLHMIKQRIRRTLSPEEKRLLLESLQRSSDFEDDSRIELFGEIANSFRNKLNIPKDEMNHLSDEQLLRNIAEFI